MVRTVPIDESEPMDEGTSGSRVPEHELREMYGLTEREADVARLLASRRSNAEIAEALGISPHTARRHTENVLHKIRVNSRFDVEKALRDVDWTSGR